MQYLVSKDNFTKITEPKGTLQNISRTLTIEVSNTQTENSGVLLPPMCKIQFDGDSVYVRCVDGAGAEARVIPFEVVVKGGDGGGTDFSLDQAGTTIVEDFKFSALEYPNATNPNLDGKTVLVMAVKDANETTQLVKYVFVDLAKLVGTATLYKPSDNAIGISGASIGLNLSADEGNILSVADDGLYARLGVAGGVSGNFAILGESGAIVDGGVSFADFVTPDFTGATSGISGLSGLVPAPVAGDEEKFLRGDGTWATVSSGSAGGTVLSTVPATVDGGVWFEMIGGNPYLKLFSGTKTYMFPTPSIPIRTEIITLQREANYWDSPEAEAPVEQDKTSLMPSDKYQREVTITRAQIAWPFSADTWRPGDMETDPTRNYAMNALSIDVKTKVSARAERIVIRGTVPKCTTLTDVVEYRISMLYPQIDRVTMTMYLDENTTAGDITSELRLRYEMPAPYETAEFIFRVTGLSATTAINKIFPA